MARLIKGRYDSGGGGGPIDPPPVGDYPAAVTSASAQVAWDLQTSTGYRPANVTKSIAVDGFPSADWVLEPCPGAGSTGLRMRSTHDGAMLIGYDLRATGYGLNVIHSNCIVRDNRFSFASVDPFGISGQIGVINLSTGQVITNTLIEYNELDGGCSPASPSPRNSVACIYERQTGEVSNTTIRGNWLHHYGGDGIDLAGPGWLVERNRIQIGGWYVPGQDPHMDQLQIYGPLPGSSGIAQDNFLDMTPDPLHTAGRTSSTTLNVSGGGAYIYRRNVIGFGARVPDVTGVGRVPVMYSAIQTSVNIHVTNNVFDYRDSGSALGPMAGTTVYGITEWANNYYLPDGRPIPHPSPGTFTLPTINAAAHNIIYAAQIRITNYPANTPLSIINGQWRKTALGGTPTALTTAPGTVSDGDVVEVLMNGPTGLSSTAVMTLTIGGVAKTMTVNSGTAMESLLYFYGPHNTLAAEAAIVGDWATHKGLMDINRVDNLRWLMSGVQNDPSLALYIRSGRGASTAADDKTDGDAYLDAPQDLVHTPGTSADTSGYVATGSNPTLWNSQDNHRIAHSPAAYYLLNGTHLDWARAMVDNCEWQYEESSGPNTAYNNAAIFWSQRSMAKYFGSLVAGRWVGAQPGGSVGITPGNYTGGTAQLAIDFLAQILSRQDARGAWPLANAHSYTKPWQDTQILHHLILYHKNFDPLNDTLRAAILKCCDWLWCLHSQYSDPVTPTFSTTSGKWTAVYMDKYDGDPGSGGAPDTLNGMADLSMFYAFGFAYAYYLTHDTTWRSRLRGILKAAVQDAWYAGGAKWWGELSLGSMGSYYDQLVFTAVAHPIISTYPSGSVAANVYTITSDGVWLNLNDATEYEIWHWKRSPSASAIFHRIATAKTVSVAPYAGSGDLVKGRVRRHNANGGWSTWVDTAWTVV